MAKKTPIVNTFEDTTAHDEMSHLDDGGITIAQVKEHAGALSESLVSVLDDGPLRIEGLGLDGAKRPVEITRSGLYISASPIQFGHTTGELFNIAWLSKEGRWVYSKGFLKALDEAWSKKLANTWYEKVHTYYRT